MEYVEGMSMAELGDEQRTTVGQQLEQHLQIMRSLHTSRIGGPSEIVILLYRATLRLLRDRWSTNEYDSQEYVFCHGDLSQQNVVVNPKTMKIKAIRD